LAKPPTSAVAKTSVPVTVNDAPSNKLPTSPPNPITATDESGQEQCSAVSGKRPLPEYPVTARGSSSPSVPKATSSTVRPSHSETLMEKLRASIDRKDPHVEE